MAGIVLPTPMLLVALTGFTIVRHVMDVPLDLERAIVFPLAVVPNAWGLWNVLYLALQRRNRELPIGVHGAMLPLVLVPGGYYLGCLAGLSYLTPAVPLIAIPLAMAIYYLEWKFLVNYCNHLLGIA